MTARRDVVTCALVDQWLDDWVAGRLDAHLGSRLAAHVDACERCQRLVALVRAAAGSDSFADDEADVDLVGDVMTRTSGGACARAGEWLPLLVDGEVEADTRAILDAHLAHCEACAQLRAAIEESRDMLPSLAEMQPPPGFAEQVLAATVRAPQPVGIREAPAHAVSAFGRWWLRVLARPRASLELAYIGALVIMVVLGGNPVAAFRDAGERAGRLAQSVPVAQLTERLPRESTIGVVGQVLNVVTSAANAVLGEVAHRWQQMRAIVGRIESAVADAWKWIAAIDVTQWYRDVQRLLFPRHETQPQHSPPR